MKQREWLPKHDDEINKLCENHLGALAELAISSCDMGVEFGMRTGMRKALFGAAIGMVVMAVSMCATGITYLKRK